MKNLFLFITPFYFLLFCSTFSFTIHNDCLLDICCERRYAERCPSPECVTLDTCLNNPLSTFEDECRSYTTKSECDSASNLGCRFFSKDECKKMKCSDIGIDDCDLTPFCFWNPAVEGCLSNCTLYSSQTCIDATHCMWKDTSCEFSDCFGTADGNPPSCSDKWCRYSAGECKFDCASRSKASCEESKLCQWHGCSSSGARCFEKQSESSCYTTYGCRWNGNCVPAEYRPDELMYWSLSNNGCPFCPLYPKSPCYSPHPDIGDIKGPCVGGPSPDCIALVNWYCCDIDSPGACWGDPACNHPLLAPFVTCPLNTCPWGNNTNLCDSLNPSNCDWNDLKSRMSDWIQFHSPVSPD